MDVFPDYTVNQLVRLSNAAFDTNKVVPKGNSMKMVAFVPLELLLSKEEIKAYRKNPHQAWAQTFSIYRLIVDGSLVSPVKESADSN